MAGLEAEFNDEEGGGAELMCSASMPRLMLSTTLLAWYGIAPLTLDDPPAGRCRKGSVK